MDLMKLLKAKTEHLLAKAPKDEYQLCEKILANTKIQFDAFLKDVSKLEEFKKHNPLEGIRALSGEALIEDEYGVLGKSPYVFLRIPGHPGLLLEPLSADELALLQATEARPFQRRWNGDMSSQVVFVRKPTPLATYKALEEDIVRNVSTQKTFSGTQFFEHLVETLIMHINAKPE
ncbi:MAG: hypothetical protein EBR09_15365 [Proteobacteria bacterium]|nr:hypothetical protein [Pseudomonadota bacterium]